MSAMRTVPGSGRTQRGTMRPPMRYPRLPSCYRRMIPAGCTSLQHSAGVNGEVGNESYGTEGCRSLQRSAGVNEEVGDESCSRIWQEQSRNYEPSNVLPKTAKLLPKDLCGPQMPPETTNLTPKDDTCRLHKSPAKHWCE